MLAGVSLVSFPVKHKVITDGHGGASVPVPVLNTLSTRPILVQILQSRSKRSVRIWVAGGALQCSFCTARDTEYTNHRHAEDASVPGVSCSRAPVLS